MAYSAHTGACGQKTPQLTDGDGDTGNGKTTGPIGNTTAATQHAHDSNGLQTPLQSLSSQSPCSSASAQQASPVQQTSACDTPAHTGCTDSVSTSKAKSVQSNFTL